MSNNATCQIPVEEPVLHIVVLIASKFICHSQFSEIPGVHTFSVLYK